MDALQNSIIAAINPSSYVMSQKQSLHAEIQVVLTKIPSLIARCHQYLINRSQVNLVTLEGNLPVFYRKVKYNIPIKFIYPLNYPNDPPSLYVQPTQNMILNLHNKRVSSDGKISLKSLEKWQRKTSTLEVLQEAKILFENDTPLLSTSGVTQIQSYPQPVSSSSALFNGSYNTVSGIVNSLTGSKPGTGVVPTNNQHGHPDHNQGPQRQGAGFYPPVSSQNSQYINPAPVHSSQQVGYCTQNNQALSKKALPNLTLVKAIYLQQIKEVNDEINLLVNESQILDNKNKAISNELEANQKQFFEIDSKIELLKASIVNSQEWIDQNKTPQPCGEAETLIEYRNDSARYYLELLASEKSKENTVAVLVEAMQKGVYSYKEGIPVVRNLFNDVFMTIKLKEKALNLSKAS